MHTHTLLLVLLEARRHASLASAGAAITAGIDVIVPPPPSCPNASKPMRMGRNGDDLPPPHLGNLTMDACAEVCCANANCVAWEWASSTPQGWNAGCTSTAGQSCCILKTGPGWSDSNGGVCGPGCESWSGLSGRPSAGHPPPPSPPDGITAPLRQRFRPPRYTTVQKTAMERIAANAVRDSAAAKGWALSYMNSSAVRGRLDASLQHYSDDQLLEMLAWEMDHLPIYHDIPINELIESEAGGGSTGQLWDDTGLNISLDNGYLQSPCQRTVLGGPQNLVDALQYSGIYTDSFGWKEDRGDETCKTDETPLTITISGTTDSGCRQPACSDPHWADGEWVRDGSSNGRQMWKQVTDGRNKLRWEGGTWLICGGAGCPNDACPKSMCFAQTQSSAQLPPKLWGGAILAYKCGQPPECDYIATLRAANDCLNFNTNNLMKEGNGGGFGSSSDVAFVLNRKTMADSRNPRIFLEPGDGGRFAMSGDWPLGITGAWFHLLQRHEQIWVDWATCQSSNGDCFWTKNGYSIADMFNHWWLPKTYPLSHLRQRGGVFTAGMDYFETISTPPWLPEDLLCIIVEYDAEFHCPPNHQCSMNPDSGGGFMYGLRGQSQGRELRNWARKHRRPLVWSKHATDDMILDPYVGGFSGHTITDADRQLFERHWSAPPWEGPNFEQLAAAMPAHLHFHWPSWFHRKACAAKKNSPGMMLGVDSNGNCVWWDGDEPQEQLRWECLSDGTCEQSASSRATFESEDACLADCAHAWQCVSRFPHLNGADGFDGAIGASGARYCLPSTRSTMHSEYNPSSKVIPDGIRVNGSSSGCGEPSGVYNDWWNLKGEQNGRPKWGRKGNSNDEIRWENNHWILSAAWSPNGDTEYKIKSDASLPPHSGWVGTGDHGCTGSLTITYDSGAQFSSVFASIGACEAACVPTYSTTVPAGNLKLTCAPELEPAPAQQPPNSGDRASRPSLLVLYLALSVVGCLLCVRCIKGRQSKQGPQEVVLERLSQTP